MVVFLLCITLVYDIAKHLWVGIIREQVSQLCACLAAQYNHRAVGSSLTYGIAVLQTWGWYSALRLSCWFCCGPVGVLEVYSTPLCSRHVAVCPLLVLLWGGESIGIQHDCATVFLVGFTVGQVYSMTVQQSFLLVLLWDNRNIVGGKYH